VKGNTEEELVLLFEYGQTAHSSE